MNLTGVVIFFFPNNLIVCATKSGSTSSHGNCSKLHFGVAVEVNAKEACVGFV